MKNTDTLATKKELAFSCGNEKISLFIDSLNVPAVYSRLVYLGDGKPVDYVFLKVNEAFEKMSGLDRTAVSGKLFLEAGPKIDEHADLISILANVALTGIPAQAERFIKPFNRWVNIHVFSPEKGYFIEVMEDITERKRLETELGFNTQNLKQLTSSENGLWILDAHGVTSYVNTKMANMLGCTIKEMLETSFLNFLNEHSRVIATEAGLPFRMLKNKRLELQLHDKIGTPVYALVEAVEVNGENGEFNGLILNIKDISEQKRVEQALLKSQKKYSALFQHLTDGFAYCQVHFDNNGTPIDCSFSDVNSTFRRLTGIGDNPILGKRINEVFPVLEKIFPDWQKLCKVIVKEKTVSFEKYSSQSNRWFAVQAYCPETGHIAIILQEITQRKKAISALKQSEKRYKKLANSIADLFFAVDSKLKFTYWNSASQRYTGINVNDAVGKRVYEVFGRTKTTKRAIKVFLEVMRTRRAQTFTDKLPKRGRKLHF